MKRAKKIPWTVQRVRLRQVKDGSIKFGVEQIQRPVDVYRAVLPFYKGADREILSVLCLDAQSVPTCFHVVSMGGLNTTRSHPTEIFKVAILSNALGIVLCHNHPSGTLEPSTDDTEFTHNVRRAGELMGIELFDHLIVTDDGFTSMRERGLL
jgi:DNA repair protein RadC